MSAFELRPLARMGENAWETDCVWNKFNAIAPSIEVPGLGTRPYLARARTSNAYSSESVVGGFAIFFY